MSFTDTLFDKIESIAATSGKKDKQALVATFTADDLRVIRWALDPTVTFYIAKLAPATKTGNDQWGDAEEVLLRKLSTREVTGNAALEQVGFSMRELTPKSAELLRRVILKDLRAGFGASTVNAAFPGAIPDFAYMRCSLPKDSNIEKWSWEDGVYSQLKANGMFARIDVSDGVLITTRQGNTFPDGALMELAQSAGEVFDQGTQSHGELTVWRNGVLLPRSEGNGMLNSLMQGGELEPGCDVRFDVWDQIPLSAALPKGRYDVPYRTRFYNLLQQVTLAHQNRIMLIENHIVYSRAEAKDHYKEVLGRKLEGTVLKHSEAIWRDGDSKDQVKFKLEVDVDLEIVGFNPGTPGTRTEATFGSVKCATRDRLLEVDVAGFSRALEAWLHENRDSVPGMIMCVRANEVSPPCETNPLHSLYHPRVVELRRDKKEADTLQMVLDQFAAAVSA